MKPFNLLVDYTIVEIDNSSCREVLRSYYTYITIFHIYMDSYCKLASASYVEFENFSYDTILAVRTILVFSN
jgi:hypothetical protein